MISGFAQPQAQRDQPPGTLADPTRHPTRPRKAVQTSGSDQL